MRNFNPNRELNKIKYRKRNKIVIGIIILLVIISIGSTFALYQVRHSKRIIYTTVSDFRNNKDIILAVYYDNQEQNDFPKKGDNYVFDHIDCDIKDKDYTVASWNYNVWGLNVLTKGPNKCDVYFRKLDKYQDTSGANPPELYQGLIPVYYGDNGEVYVANLEQEWYDYDKHEWANAVLIDTTSKTIKDKYFNEDNTINSEAYNEEIPMDEILQMYVWIPRYKYELFNAKNESKSEQMINIEFERGTETTGTVTCSIANNGVETCENDDNGQWYTHPAFIFGNTNLTGLWVGKFEPSDPTDPVGNANNKINEITILPNKVSMVMKSVKTIFNAEKEMEKENNKYNLKKGEIDAHIMKNMDWGAVVYLTSSKYGIYSSDGQSCMIAGMTKENCEVWKNNSLQGASTAFYGAYTGCAGSSVNTTTNYNNPAKCDIDKRWNTQTGVKASTTGNMYGIYDMSGGTFDAVMGVITNKTGTEPYYGGSGYTKADMIDSKYYDLYEYGNSAATQNRGHLGDATREIMKNYGSHQGGWTNDLSDIPFDGSADIVVWFARGGSATYNTGGAGIFMYGTWRGGEYRLWNYFTFRSVISHA